MSSLSMPTPENTSVNILYGNVQCDTLLQVQVALFKLIHKKKKKKKKEKDFQMHFTMQLTDGKLSDMN